jgi:hypothetical protein
MPGYHLDKIAPKVELSQECVFGLSIHRLNGRRFSTPRGKKLKSHSILAIQRTSFIGTMRYESAFGTALMFLMGEVILLGYVLYLCHELSYGFVGIRAVSIIKSAFDTIVCFDDIEDGIVAWI